MRIIVQRECTGIAPRWAQWQATTADYGGPPEPVGCGATPVEAMDDLLWALDVKPDTPCCITIEG